ncbi:hypothetical protein EX30DRAFT_264651 [Ascodesmis nigricans]|uniref:Uncharacterized protein n=1 Tax=Ascodesmis nigricans TaxID=341454 RepID=A0A4S2MXQ8_9PEZI|nr:hypothetical protein EX30DRAFT_264651 [Ascodesmis nigricans]
MCIRSYYYYTGTPWHSAPRTTPRKLNPSTARTLPCAGNGGVREHCCRLLFLLFLFLFFFLLLFICFFLRLLRLLFPHRNTNLTRPIADPIIPIIPPVIGISFSFIVVVSGTRRTNRWLHGKVWWGGGGAPRDGSGEEEGREQEQGGVVGEGIH